MKRVLSVMVGMFIVGATMWAGLGAADAHCVRNCRPGPWLPNQWGHGGWVRTWGLGGIADAPWVGGATTGVMPYGPQPYNRVHGL